MWVTSANEVSEGIGHWAAMHGGRGAGSEITWRAGVLCGVQRVPWGGQEEDCFSSTWQILSL